MDYPEEVTREWVSRFVVGMNLCPFAKREVVKNKIRYQVTSATTEEKLLCVLTNEIVYLDEHPEIETTLLIHPEALQDFYDYNQFLNSVDSLIEDLDRDGIYQVASFHPDYQFGGTSNEDAENYTNRSPFPMLHLLRESSLARAIDAYGSVDDIPERNIALMNKLGANHLSLLLKGCFDQKGGLG